MLHLIPIAKPNTQPAGVQGALFNKLYHSDFTSTDVNKLPSASAAKFKNKNIIVFNTINILYNLVHLLMINYQNLLDPIH